MMLKTHRRDAEGAEVGAENVKLKHYS